MKYSLVQSHDFSESTALVMGASRGIGLATAQVLAAYGAHVVLCARTEDAVIEAADTINASGGSAEAYACNVTDYGAVKALIDDVVSRRGSLDLLVNNAGVIEPLAHLANSDPEQWSLAIDVNIKGVYHAMHAALPHMIEMKNGTIVNLSSGAANSSLVGWSHYCATKAAAKKLTEVAHKEVSDHGVRIVGLSPGTVATDMMRKIRDAKINVVSSLDWSQHIPPEWVGEGVAFLFSSGGDAYLGGDFSIKTREGRAAVGLPQEGALDV